MQVKVEDIETVKKPRKHVIFKLLCLFIIVNCFVDIIPVTDALLMFTIPITLWHLLLVAIDKTSKIGQNQDSIWKDVLLKCGKYHKTPVQLISILKKKYTIKEK